MSYRSGSGSVGSLAEARIGLHVLSARAHRIHDGDPDFNSSSPSHQWGNLLCVVTRCQNDSIRNEFGLNWKRIQLLFLDWIELKLFIGLNTQTHILTWNLTWKCHSFQNCILSSYYLNVIWNYCGPLWIDCEGILLPVKERKETAQDGNGNPKIGAT